jgi:hypothetical protein
MRAMAFCREWCENVPMSQKCFFYVYSSVATKAFTESELLELLERSREANAKLGLSGMLLYKNGDFLQVLEGPEEVVRTMIRKIRLDPRHKSMLKLLEGDYDGRQFPYWHMGFRNLDTEEAKKTPGYTEFLNTPLSVGLAADPTVCQRLLHLFKERER